MVGSIATSWPSLGNLERTTLVELLVDGPQSRAEIARKLGLSRASLTRVARSLINQGFVTEGALELRGATGRPSEMLQVDPSARRFLGVKLTDDTLYAVVTDLAGTIQASHSERLVSTSVEDTVDQLAAVRQRLAPEGGEIAAAGISLAGDVTRIDGRQVVINSPFLGWRDVLLADLLTERLGVPVATENDVRSLTAAEHWFGVGAGVDSMVLITVGVGVGVGIVIDGSVIGGTHGTAGQLDHLIIDPNGPRCEQHRGCVSSFLTNFGLVAALRSPGIGYPEAVRLAHAGDPAARQAFYDAGHALGVLVATLANTLDPEKIVITGDGIAVTELADKAIEESIALHRRPPDGPVALDIQPFEFSQWARGGAVLAIRHCLDF